MSDRGAHRNRGHRRRASWPRAQLPSEPAGLRARRPRGGRIADRWRTQRWDSATGYTLNFGWVELPIRDARGVPEHRRGVTGMPGVYFLGLPWLHKRKSSFLGGVGEDAEFLAERIAGRDPEGCSIGLG